MTHETTNETNQRVYNTIIVGSGPAGLTAAIYAARANLKPLCIEGFSAGGLIPGGQLMFTTEVENYPGFPEKVRGSDLMERMRLQAERQGTSFITADVTRVDLSERPFKVWVDGPDPLFAKTLIIATGASARYLGLESEERLKNRGVSGCAVCDGALYRDRDVAVVGGGDTAIEEATYLAGLCKSVTLIHRRDEFRASQAMQKRLTDNPKIRVLYSHIVVDVLDPEKGEVTGLRVQSTKTGEQRVIAVDALFLAIGHSPNTQLVQGQLELHPNKYIKTQPGSTQTSVRGVFAAGDVQDFTFRQAVTAAGSGCMAALEVERLLASEA